MNLVLHRSLAVRFAATMAVGLSLASGALFWAISRVMEQPLDQALVHGVQRDLLVALLGVILVGTAATLVGAWNLAASAVRPVAEITAQATRIEAGTLDQRIAAHADTEEHRDLVAVLNRMLDRIEEKQLTVEQRLDAGAQLVPLDPILVIRLVEQLLENAVKFVPDGGRVAVSTQAAVPAARGVRLSVENSGPPIAAEDFPHIFEPFYRGDPARS